MADNTLVISAYGLSAPGKGQNLDNMYLNGRYINVPTETSSKIQKQETGPFQVYGVSDSEIGIGEDRSIGAETGSIVMDMLHYSQTSLNNKRIEKEPIWEAVTEANRATKEIRTQAGVDTLGTSFAALFLHGNRGLAVHLGDSRIYVIRGGRTLQITDDHLESSDMFRLGILTQAQAEVHKSSSRLTAYVGMDNVYDSRDEAFSKFFVFYPGDIFILCTDGITDAILNDKLEKVTRLLKDATPDQIASTLMDAAGEHSTADRTIVVLRIEAVGNEVAQRAVPTTPAPTQAAFNEQQPMNPAVPTQHSLNQPLPASVQPQIQETQPVQVQAPVSAAPAAPQSAPAPEPVNNYPRTTQPAPAPVEYPADQEEDEEEEPSKLAAIIDNLMADKKRLMMIIGIAAAALLLLIILIVIIASAGKNKETEDSSSSKTNSKIESSIVVDSSETSQESSSVVPVYESSSVAVESSTTTEPTSKFPIAYEIEDGDTIYGIVLEYYDTADLDVMEALAKYNNFDLDDGLEVGQKLTLPEPSVLGITEETEDSEE